MDELIQNGKLSYVYIVSNVIFPGWYKVGISKNVNKRLKDFQTYDPFRRYVLEYSKQSRYFKVIEKHIHTKFESKHEWVAAPLVDIIREIEKYKYDH